MTTVPDESIKLTWPKFRAGEPRSGWVSIWLVDEAGQLLHTEPVCSVPVPWHQWFVEWVQKHPVPVLLPALRGILDQPRPASTDVDAET